MYNESRWLINTPKTKELEDVSLDEWTPTPKSTSFRVPSQWRREMNRGKPPSRPSRDDLKKIKAYLSKRVDDKEIIKTFNITKRTLAEIKNGSYRLLLDSIGRIDTTERKVKEEIEDVEQVQSEAE